MGDWGAAASAALVGVTLLAALAGWPAAPAVVRGGGYDGRTPGRRRLRPPRLLAGPGRSLLAVTALIYLNQLLFTVYVIRVHGGDPSFVARFLPDGWFDLAADSTLVLAAAAAFPAPELLAPSVLRVQAFLELPFVLLAYLTVCRWLDPALYVRIARSRLIWVSSASYTAAFCVIELTLRNPYTVDDIALRLAAALAAPAWIFWTARHDPHERAARPRPLSAAGLLAFTASVWALGLLVLAVYDTALLYNLGHVGARLPGAAVALAVLAAARLGARLVDARTAAAPQPASLGSDMIASMIRWFLVLFFVIALPARYAAGEPAVQAVGAVAVLAAAACGGLGSLRGASRPQSSAVRPLRRTIATGIAALGLAVLVGLATAYAVLSWVPANYPETVLLHAAAAFLATTIAVNGISASVRCLTRP